MTELAQMPITGDEPVNVLNKAKPKQKDGRPLIASIIDLMDNLPKQVAAVVELFPGKEGKLYRMLTYSYLYSVWAFDQPGVNPRHFPLNLIGEPGQGKSAVVKDWARKLGMEVVMRTLAGVSEFESLFGIVHIDPDYDNEGFGRTKLYSPKNMPLPHEDDRYGIVFLDDFNRGEQQSIPAAMEFVNTGAYNDYRLPRHFGIVAASNPQGVGNKVKSLDNAQFTRFCNVIIEGDPDVFIDQLAIQGAPPQLYAYHAKFKDQLMANELGMDGAAKRSEKYKLPDPRPLNHRNRMGHALISRWAQHDKPVMHDISVAVYGETFMRLLATIESGDWPIEVDDVLNDPIEKTTGRVKTFVTRRKQDALVATVQMLVSYLNRHDTVLSHDQLDRVCEFFLAVPESSAMVGLRRLVLKGAPRGDHYVQLFMLWRSPNGVKAGPLGNHFLKMTRTAMAEVKEARKDPGSATQQAQSA